jgi:glycine/D-amino acid oxidase-like deaminating enzyme/nitrite reductase/ring-hydroxylating ferredoxin subunit
MFQRDANTKSLWQEQSPGFVPQSAPGDQRSFDVIIAGGGITGFTTALRLQQQGLRCMIAEAANACFGTTGGTTAHLNTLLDTPYPTIEKNFGKEAGRLIVNATRDAIRLATENVTSLQIECGFETAVANLYAQTKEQEEELEQIEKAAAAAGLETSLGSVAPPFIGRRALMVPGQAKFDPVAYTLALAKAFEELGGIVCEHCRVTAVREEERLTIETNAGTFTAQHLVWATHIPPGVNLLHLRCTPWRSYAMAFTIDSGDYPSQLIYDMENPYNYYRSQKIGCHEFIVAGGKDHKTGEHVHAYSRFTELEAQVRRYFDVKEIVARWSSQFFESADGLPYIGHLPGAPKNVYVATGFGGNGVTYSHVAAQLLTDIITGRLNILQELLSPGRIKPVAGFKNFMAQSAEVVVNFAEKIFGAEELESLSALAAGEARIVKLNDETVGLFKDQHGQLHAVNPVCTHLKCTVHWNDAELSWDCPCHGARYNPDGTVLTGPADRPLEKINIGSISIQDAQE